MVNVLILSPLRPQTGNFTTATRIRTYLESGHYTCFMLSLLEIQDSKLDLANWCKEREIRLVVAIHALHCGRVYSWNKSDMRHIQLLVILGGTDVNEAWKQQETMAIMTNFLHEAKLVIGFTSAMIDKATILWPFLGPDKCRKIPQAITVVPSSTFSLQSRIRSEHSWYTAEPICIIVSGIRPVKDPLYTVEVFSTWRTTQTPSPVLVIVGPILDREYWNTFNSLVQATTGVVFIPGLSLEETHAAIQQSFCLINSSLSEGMSAAILEAMALGTPVIARAIPGNIALVDHMKTGLVYESPEDCVRCVSLINTTEFRTELSRNALAYVQKHHNPTQEANKYLRAVSKCLYFLS